MRAAAKSHHQRRSSTKFTSRQRARRTRASKARCWMNATHPPTLLPRKHHRRGSDCVSGSVLRNPTCASTIDDFTKVGRTSANSRPRESSFASPSMASSMRVRIADIDRVSAVLSRIKGRLRRPLRRLRGFALDAPSARRWLLAKSAMRTTARRNIC